MPITEWKNHDKMVGIHVYDCLALGEEAKNSLGNLLYDLEEVAKLPFATLAQKQNLAKFTKTFYELIQLIAEFGSAVNSPLTNDVAAYLDALHKLDAAVQEDDVHFLRELHDMKILAKKILKQFLLTQESPTNSEIAKPQKKVKGFFAKLFGQLHDK